MANNTLDNYLCQLINECETLEELNNFIQLWGIDQNDPYVMNRREVLASQLFQLLSKSSSYTFDNEKLERLNDLEEIISGDNVIWTSQNDKKDNKDTEVSSFSIKSYKFLKLVAYMIIYIS